MTNTRVEHVANQIRSQIKTGQYSPHERFASELKLQEEYGVSGDTIRKALGRLVAEGIIYRIPWKGTFISPTAKVGRILIVTNFETVTVADDFGLLYGYSAFEHGLRRYESQIELPYTLIPIDSDTYMNHAHEIHLIHKDLAGIIFFRDFRPVLATQLLLEELRVPYIFYGAAERCRGHMTRGNTYCYKNQELMETALEFLVKKGHKRIVCVQSESSSGRYKFYEKWMHQKGLWTDDLADVEIDGSRLLTDPHELQKRATAVVAICDKDAIVMLNALTRAGVQVPAQVAVMGIDNYPIDLHTIVPLTSIDIPLEKDAARCLDLFVELLEGHRNIINEKSRISVMEREST